MFKQSNPLYHTAAWQKIRLFVLVRDNYLCQPCLRRQGITGANTVHHIKPLEQYPELALDPDNLESCCPLCHNRLHPEKRSQPKAKCKKRRARVIVDRGNPELYTGSKSCMRIG